MYKRQKAASSSWGSELDGHMVEAWNGEQRAYSKYGNKLEDYFNTGFAHNHNVSISNVTDKSHFRASFGSSNNKGLFPNEKLDKINIDLNAGAEMNQYLSMEGKVSLSRTKAVPNVRNLIRAIQRKIVKTKVARLLSIS